LEEKIDALEELDLDTETEKLWIERLSEYRYVKNVYEMSIFDFIPDVKRDLVIIKTVLIHINPDFLPKVYELLYESSSKFICIAEYYNPTPVTVEYRGHNERLFKRDFAGEILSKYPDLKLVDYGFFYHRDNNYPIDDINWFLLKKGD
jgi:pseudaminic acid biosynthesis-associated methylase